MNLPNLNYVVGNVDPTDEYKEKQMEVNSSTQVVVASTTAPNREEEIWSIKPAPGPNVYVTIQSKKHKGHFLSSDVDSNKKCKSNLSTTGSKFLLEYVEMDGNEKVYNIKVTQGSADCINKYLTMDDPKGGRGIHLVDKMPKASSKQKWKFKSASSGGSGAG